MLDNGTATKRHRSQITRRTLCTLVFTGVMGMTTVVVAADSKVVAGRQTFPRKWDQWLEPEQPNLHVALEIRLWDADEV